MEVSKTLYVTGREQWRAWLEKNYKTEKDIWLIYYRAHTKKKRISYNDAVEVALCFGWIDSIIKRIDDEKFMQRFSPRRPNSVLSEANKARIRHLIDSGEMTPDGLEAVKHAFDPSEKFEIAADILKVLQEDKVVWKNFQTFPDLYKQIRIGWIEGARDSPKVFKQRLDFFLKKTAKNQKYGMVQ
jgi:uncharacterized protein YdeI (YjbR/CyaY-like superfamily)